MSFLLRIPQFTWQLIHNATRGSFRGVKQPQPPTPPPSLLSTQSPPPPPPPSGDTKKTPSYFRMPLHYPRYKRADYEGMPEWKLDLLLAEYGLPATGSLDEKRKFAIGAFMWPESK